MNLLIVDDSAMMRAMIRRVIRLCDVPVGEVFEARNGLEALRVLETCDVHVLMTDLNMPSMNGQELLQAIARQERWSHVRRVIISSDGSAFRRREGVEWKVEHYVEKPLTPEAMRDVLTELAKSVASE